MKSTTPQQIAARLRQKQSGTVVQRRMILVGVWVALLVMVIVTVIHGGVETRSAAPPTPAPPTLTSAPFLRDDPPLPPTKAPLEAPLGGDTAPKAIGKNGGRNLV